MPHLTDKKKVLDLFSGIGGFSLGLENTGGFETVAFCEIEPFCRAVLQRHWPGVNCYEDITHTRFNEDVDLVTAGFPCQDISLAGSGAGLTGERSGLYWYILRTLCMVGRPPLLLENVAGLLVRGAHAIFGSLATFGYDTQWHCIPASAVGAPHRRDRIWIIANSESFRLQRGNGQNSDHQTLLLEKLPALLLRGNRDWDQLPASRICRKDDGVPDRSHRLKALGNSVVPQIPELIGQAILECTELNPNLVEEIPAANDAVYGETLKQHDAKN